MAAKGSHIDFMFLAPLPLTRPLDPMLQGAFCTAGERCSVSGFLSIKYVHTEAKIKHNQPFSEIVLILDKVKISVHKETELNVVNVSRFLGFPDHVFSVLDEF